MRQARGKQSGRWMMAVLLMMYGVVNAQPANDSVARPVGRYVLIQDNGWTNIRLPDGTMAEVAPLPVTNTGSLYLDENHYCSQTNAQFTAGIVTVMYGRWRMRHDTLTLTFSKQMSNLWFPPSIQPMPTPYKIQYLVDEGGAVLRACMVEGKGVYRREGI